MIRILFTTSLSDTVYLIITILPVLPKVINHFNIFNSYHVMNSGALGRGLCASREESK